MNPAARVFDIARRLPERPAVSDDRNAWTYREFAARIARVAGGVRACGLVPGDRVLLSLENRGELFELLFGCWAAGLCAVPANTLLHPREMEFIAANSGAWLMVAPHRPWRCGRLARPRDRDAQPFFSNGSIVVFWNTS